MTTWTVRETIEHGTYRNVREVTIEPSTIGVRELLAGSPYNAGAADKHDVVLGLLEELDTNHQAGRGWAEYEVIRVDVPLEERLAEVSRRLAEATDRAGWANTATDEGRLELAGAVVDLGRAATSLVAIMREEARR